MAGRRFCCHPFGKREGERRRKKRQRGEAVVVSSRCRLPKSRLSPCRRRVFARQTHKQKRPRRLAKQRVAVLCYRTGREYERKPRVSAQEERGEGEWLLQNQRRGERGTIRFKSPRERVLTWGLEAAALDSATLPTWLEPPRLGNQKRRERAATERAFFWPPRIAE